MTKAERRLTHFDKLYSPQMVVTIYKYTIENDLKRKEKKERRKTHRQTNSPLAQSSKIRTVTNGFNARLANRPFLGRLFDRVDLIKPVSYDRPWICPSVRPSVRSSFHKMFLRFQWNLACRYRSMSDARRYAVWPHPRSRSRSRALQSWKSGHFQKLSPPPFTMGAGNWPRILKLRHNIYIWSRRIFYICPSFCVTWLWTWQKCPLRRVDRQFPAVRG